jgi:hypothetical protein
MSISSVALLESATRLHRYLVREHWNGETLAGGDSGVRWEFHVGRFIKSYLPFLPGSERLVFLQTQGYWTLCNWLLFDFCGEEKYREIALACSRYMVASQQDTGYWVYPPLRSRRGKIATVEGNYASIALLESYRRTQARSFLAAANKWHHFLIHGIGLRKDNGLLAINYWATPSAGLVPNNTASTLCTLANLADATGNREILKPCRGMIAWLEKVQKDNGELPYCVGGAGGGDRPHFLCFQYNAFQCLNLARYYRLTGDATARRILERLAGFLSTGITDDGAARCDCYHDLPEVPYYTAALGAALSEAGNLGLRPHDDLEEVLYARVLALQQTDGGIQFFSAGNYGLLTDRRSYPRNLSMILYHLLLRARSQATEIDTGVVVTDAANCTDRAPRV